MQPTPDFGIPEDRWWVEVKMTYEMNTTMSWQTVVREGNF
jgi:hypothetical protein